MNTPVHVPILTEVLLEHLQLRPGDRCIDATVDGGGHTAAMLARTAPDGCVLGIDRDPELLSGLRRRLASEIDGGRLRLACGSFRQLAEIAAASAEETFRTGLSWLFAFCQQSASGRSDSPAAGD